MNNEEQEGDSSVFKYDIRTKDIILIMMKNEK